jgi:hypothetical protein
MERKGEKKNGGRVCAVVVWEAVIWWRNLFAVSWHWGLLLLLLGVARWFICKPKTKFGYIYFRGPLIGQCCNIFYGDLDGIFYRHLEYVMTLWYITWAFDTFFLILVSCTYQKNLATLLLLVSQTQLRMPTWLLALTQWLFAPKTRPPFF